MSNQQSLLNLIIALSEGAKKAKVKYLRKTAVVRDTAPLNAPKVARVGLIKEHGWLYYVDKDGDIARSRMARGNDNKPKIKSKKKKITTTEPKDYYTKAKTVRKTKTKKTTHKNKKTTKSTKKTVPKKEIIKTIKVVSSSPINIPAEDKVLDKNEIIKKLVNYIAKLEKKHTNINNKEDEIKHKELEDKINKLKEKLKTLSKS